jgi:hypothetical protein
MTREEQIESAVDAFRSLLTTLVSSPQESSDDELRIPQVAEALGCSESSVKSLLGHRGGPVRLAFHKRGSRVYVFRRDVEKYKLNEASRTEVMRDPRRRA